VLYTGIIIGNLTMLFSHAYLALHWCVFC